ncbi:hypothetical protein FB45DRAFT_920586 [Roridomyces roridus]|uniref:Cell wall protein n=1 Tax=Roridomyces roridus TaxID=1738132 RepID=A0AAD7FLU7_9AGAR|nr:hypothetical protein FB45DRAFT_920586 [Roridomyces roridus]
MLLSHLFSLAFISAACASTLNVRQTTNTNAAIRTIIDPLDMTARIVASTLNTLQANHSLNSVTLATQLTILEARLQSATTQLANTTTSAGSVTVSPTNDELGDTFGETMQLVTTSLSGISAQGSVSDFASQMSTLDPIFAATVKQFKTTAPLSVKIAQTLMLDAQQFLITEGLTETQAAIFPPPA